jgi:predicted aminopeptidase
MKRFFQSRRARKWLLLATLMVVVLAVSGCRTFKFYGQAIKGQYQIFAHQHPVEQLIADPKTPTRLKGQLELLEKLRAFAARELKLPVDGHYRKYVDVHRPFVVWNVQAAPQFSLEPKTWWYPLVGSLEYRGYFSEKGAQENARWLKARGYDVFVGSVEAYSTLGWFKDPVLNTFIYRDEPELAEVIFHELGHQRVFARGDTDFNEAFATVVGQEGARRWLQSEGNTNSYRDYLVALNRNMQFVHLIMDTRVRLEKVYGDQRDKEGKLKAAKAPPGTPEHLRAEKQKVFGELRQQYAQMKSEWDGFGGYDNWFARELNNAQLNTIANYYDYVPGFEQLLKLQDGDLEKFYKAVERLSKMSQDERHQWLRDLSEDKPVSGARPL